MRRRDEAGFEDFARARSQDLMRAALVLTGDTASAEDLVQSTLTKAYSKCHKLAGLTGPESCTKVSGGWLFTLFERPAPANGPPRALDWTATMLRRDGTSVAVVATNYGDGHLPTRPTPVLDGGQLNDLAGDQVWFQPAS